VDVILGIEADATVHDKQAAEWEKHAIKTFKVETMNEAIRYLLKNDAYFFITINADSIPHFLAQLPILSDITALPIIVYSKNISFKKRIEALDLGADAYERLYANPAKNISCFMNTLKVLERRMQRPLNPLPLLISGEVILSLSRRRVFIKDIEIIITSQEFNIL
jgi:DNA-binding response OmpR family regulator